MRGKKSKLEGLRFGRLEIIRLYGRDKNYNTLWECKCDCGNNCVVSAVHLKDSSTKSCGCLRAETLPPSNKIHGMSSSGAYSTYRAMLNRCINKDSDSYYRYGGRGISICERWIGKGGILNFFKDMGVPPSDKYQIDRIDNNGNYEPGNCRWVSSRENSRNKNNNVVLTLNGNSACLAAWSEELNIPYATLYSRLKRGGLSDKEILTLPVNHKNIKD